MPERHFQSVIDNDDTKVEKEKLYVCGSYVYPLSVTGLKLFPPLL